MMAFDSPRQVPMVAHWVQPNVKQNPRPPSIASPTSGRRRKQPRTLSGYSRVRPATADAPDINPGAVRATTVASLSSSIQTIENRVVVTPLSGRRPVSAMSRVLQQQQQQQQQQHTPSVDTRLPPMATTPGMGQTAAMLATGAVVGAAGAAHAVEAESADTAAVRLGVLPSSGMTLPLQRGLRKSSRGKPGTPGRGSHGPKLSEVQLAENWLQEVLQYGIQELLEKDDVSSAVKHSEGEGKGRFGVSREQLVALGLGEQEVDRVYRALYVYSVGFHEMVQECVGKTPERARAVTNVLQTFNFVSDVIQRTSFTNTLVDAMVKNEGQAKEISDLKKQLADAHAQVGKDSEELQVQEVLYEDSVREIQQRQRVEAVLKEQLEESQKLVEMISLPGGEIHRLKVLLEEAMLIKHNLTDELKQLRIHTADQLAAMELNVQKTLQTLEAFREEAEGIQEAMRQTLQQEKDDRAEEVGGLNSELDTTRIRLKRRESKIEELEALIKKMDQDNKKEVVELRETIENLGNANVDVKQAAETMVAEIKAETKMAIRHAKEAQKREEAVTFTLKIKKEQLTQAEEVIVEKEKEVEVAVVEKEEAVAKLELLTEELDTVKEKAVEQEVILKTIKEDLGTKVSVLEEKVAVEVKAHEKDVNALTKKVEIEKEKGKKMLVAKDENLSKLRDELKNLKAQQLQLRSEYHELEHSTTLEIERLNGVIEERDESIAKQASMLQSFETKVRELNRIKDAQQQEIRKLKSDHRKEIATMDEAFRDEKANLTMQINKLYKEMETLDSNYVAMKKCLQEEIEQANLARKNVTSELQNVEHATLEKETNLRNEFESKISVQQEQIAKISAALQQVERYRRRLVAQRTALKTNLRQNARELKDARAETDQVRKKIDEMRVEIMKLEQYLQRYRERFLTSEVGCQADTSGPVEDQVNAIKALLAANTKNNGSTVEMMNLALEVVEVLEQACSLDKGSISQFFRVATDEFDVETEQNKLALRKQTERYDAARGELAVTEKEIRRLKEVLTKVETEKSALLNDMAGLKKQIESGPEELHKLREENVLQEFQVKQMAGQVEAGVASVNGLAQQAAEAMKELELQSARDYHSLIEQVASPDMLEAIKEQLREIEGWTMQRVTQAAEELQETATEMLTRATAEAEREGTVDVLKDIGAASEVMQITREKLAQAVADKDKMHAKVMDLQQARSIQSNCPSATHRDGGAVMRGGDIVRVPTQIFVPPVEARALESWLHAATVSNQVNDEVSEAMNARQLHAACIGIYMEKIYRELIGGKPTQDLRAFTVFQFERRYGLGGVGERRLLNFIAGLRKHSKESLRLTLFSQFVRLDGDGGAVEAECPQPSDRSSPEALEFLLNVLHTLHSQLGANKVAQPVGSDAISADEDVFGWTSRWLSGPSGLTGDSGMGAAALAAAVASAAPQGVFGEQESEADMQKDVHEDGMERHLKSAQAAKDGGGSFVVKSQSTDQTVAQQIAQQLSIGTSSKLPCGVLVPIDVVKEVAHAVFAAETPYVLPKLLRYIATAEGDGLMTVRSDGSPVWATTRTEFRASAMRATDVHGEPSGGGGLDGAGLPVGGVVELDVVLMAFMRLWEDGVHQQLRAMNGMYATATGREVALRRDPRRSQVEVDALLGQHDWNPALACLGHVTNEISTRLAEEGGDAGLAVGAAQTAKDLTKALQSTNLLLSKVIKQLARDSDAAGAWSSHRLLQERLTEVAEIARVSMPPYSAGTTGLS